MILVCGNVHAFVAEATAAEDAFLRDYLSAPAQGAEFSPAFQSGAWDGRTRLYDEKTHLFPVGLVRLVAAAARPAGHAVEVRDVRARPDGEFDWSRCGWLRPYQRDALAAFLRRSRGQVVMPTGSGKTELFCALGAGLPGLRWLVLADTNDLVEQAASRFEARTGERAGRVGDGRLEPARFTVATLQTMWSRARHDAVVRGLIQGADGLVVDECHVLPAETYFHVAQLAAGAYYRFGTTATAGMRGDERDMYAVGALGPVVHSVDPAPLIEAGVIAAPRIFFVRHPNVRTTGPYNEVYDALVVVEGPRNEMVVEAARLLPRPTIVFVRRTPHGRLLAHLLGRAGMRAEYVGGEDSTAARAAAVARLERRNVDVLVCSKIFNKGVDIPSIASGINAAAGASDIDAVQRMGRLQRAAGGKTSFVYVDVEDEGNRHLSRHSAARRAAYGDMGYPVRIVDRRDLAAELGAAAQ